jgi:hypothetical protein
MRLTIWQQFSSNHSASFTVVGQFETVEKAEIAETKMNDILKRMETWRNNLDSNTKRQWAEKVYGGELTDIEREIQAEMGIKWEKAIDWFFNQEIKPVQRFKNFIFVIPPSVEVWTGPDPFDSVLSALGGQVSNYVDDSRTYRRSYSVAELNFTVPDKLDKQELVTVLDKYFQLPEETGFPPWLHYYNGSLVDKHEEFMQEALIYTLRAEIREKVHDANKELYWNLARARIKKNEELARELGGQYDAIVREALKDIPVMDNERELFFGDLLMELGATLPKIASISSGVRLSGNQITIIGLQLMNYTKTMQAIYAWLEGLGCTDIEAKFMEFPAEET